jgi:hypothetical protein
MIGAHLCQKTTGLSTDQSSEYHVIAIAIQKTKKWTGGGAKTTKELDAKMVDAPGWSL